MSSAAISTAVTGPVGRPSASIGTKAPVDAALLADSGPATPATAPRPNSSGCLEKRISKHPEEFGRGAVAGVAGPESANNAASTGAFVPMLALGLPTGPVTAVLMAALLIHGVPPGPQLVTQHPDVFWGFIASMYVGNMMLLALNLPF